MRFSVDFSALSAPDATLALGLGGRCASMGGQVKRFSSPFRLRAPTNDKPHIPGQENAITTTPLKCAWRSLKRCMSQITSDF